MIRLKHSFLSLSLMCLLISCGFRPLHTPSNKNILSTIKVGAIQGEQPYLLRAYLEDDLNTSGNSLLVIDIKLLKSLEDTLITKENIVARKNLIVTTTYTLKDLKDNRIIKTGSFKVTTSFDETGSSFASFSRSDKVYDDLIREVSRTLKARVVMSLQSQGYIQK